MTYTSPSRARTYDLAVNSRSLYRLSYRGITKTTNIRLCSIYATWGILCGIFGICQTGFQEIHPSPTGKEGFLQNTAGRRIN